MSKKTKEVAELKIETASQRYHRELDELKPKLPKDWRTQFVLANPNYDSYRGGVLINNVMSGKSTDWILFEFLKKLVETTKKKKA